MFRVEVREGEVYLDPRPVESDRRGHWLRKLDDGLEQNIRLVLAKSVIGLSEAEETGTILERVALFGARNRAAGWSAGMSILTAMGERAASAGSRRTGRVPSTTGWCISRATRPASPRTSTWSRCPRGRRGPRCTGRWLRRFIETRSAEPAERCLRTAIRIGISQEQVAEMIFAACTDHLFLDDGHALDFANKAFELLDLIGWQHAEQILPSLIGPMVRATRMEETSAWQHPVDLTSLLHDAFGDLGAALEAGGERQRGWREHRELAEQILDGEPAETLEAMLRAVSEGAPLVGLSAAVAYAAARRPVHFHLSNEFGDWDTVHHTFTYTNAVDQAMRRAPSRDLARGIFDGAMSVYLERFLNVPKQPIPQANGAQGSREALLGEFDRQQRVDETGQIVASLLAEGRHEEVVAALGHALLREDAGFHSFQIYEAAVRQYGNFRGRPEGDHVLVGAGRFLTAHAPTVRSVGQTYDIAARLHRGEALHEEEA